MPGEQGWRARAEKVWASLSLRQVLLLAGGVILLLSGVFGGLSRATPEELGIVAAREKISVAPFTITIDRARWTERLSKQLTSERGRYLVVVATVHTSEKQAVTGQTLAEAVRIGGVEGVYSSMIGGERVPTDKAEPSVLVTADGTRLDSVPGGLTYEVAFVWDQDGAEPPPDELSISLFEHTLRKSAVDTSVDWFDPTLVAEGTLPVKEGFR